MAKYHINKETGTANKCEAYLKECPIGGSHFNDREAAEKFIEKKFDKELGITASLSKKVSPESNDQNSMAKTVQLDLGLGVAEVEDGNLGNVETRRMLTNGLCGDLAKAIRDKTGGDIYFVTYNYNDSDNEQFIADISEHPDAIHEVTTHVMIESPTKPGVFMDAYGQKTKEEINSFYDVYGDGISMFKGTESMLKSYQTGNSEKLGNFAESVLKLDQENKSFDYEDYGD